MDVNFSARTQTLTLISGIAHSSSFLWSSSSFQFFSLRREFIGSGRRFRPPGLHSPRKNTTLRHPVHSPRFVFRASLSAESNLVIVAVVTFSAFAVVYLNYVRRKNNVGEVGRDLELIHPERSVLSGPNTVPLSEKDGVLMSQFIESWTLCLERLIHETPMKERKAISDETSENGFPSQEKAFELLQFQRTALMHEETTKVSEAPGPHLFSLKISGPISANESKLPVLTIPPLVLQELGVPEPENSAAKKPELQVQGRRNGAILATELPIPMVDTASSASRIPVMNCLSEMDLYHRPKLGLGEEGELQVSSYNGFFKESLREEIYIFYEKNKEGLRSTSNINGPDTAGFPKSQIPISYHKEGSSDKCKDHGKGRRFPSDNGKRLQPQNSYRSYQRFPNGMFAKDENDQTEYLRTYNHLLREGRLSECIELLEDMERKGLLDTTKVFHVRFFKTCKNQKAVEEAFRFMKLIPHPTLSTFNMLLSVCSSCQDLEGAFQALQLVKEAGLKADCKLYTTLISTCAKSGKVDAMFEVFHEMVNAEVEPNVHTYGALIDGCARAGQVAKAFGAYGIMRSKKVKPDRVIFNALITACGRSGAVDRAFDVLAEMRAETQPIDPDHITVGTLIKACAQAGQVDRAREVYKMIHQYDIKGTPDVYTIAVNSCSRSGDLVFALNVYDDMIKNGVVPDEMFLSALVDVAGHAGKLDVAFEILHDARVRGMHTGKVLYSSLMGACCNAKNWQKALELYEDIKAIKLHPTASTMNALITALCDGDQLLKAVEVLAEMKKLGICPNIITYSVLFVASEKKDDPDVGFNLLSQAKRDNVAPNLVMCRCLTAMCLRRFKKACTLGEPVLSFNSGKPQIDNKWTSLALTVYRETILAGVLPSLDVVSQVLGCLRLPHDSSLRNRIVENIGVNTELSRFSNLKSLIDGFGEYDPRSFSLVEEAASLGVLPCVSFKESLIVVDARKLDIHIAEVYLLTILKGLKHRLAAGAKLPNITILLPIEKSQVPSSKGEKIVNLAGRIGQAVGALLRRLGLPYQGSESHGKIRISGLAAKRWFQPRLASPFSGKRENLSSSPTRLGKGISSQQRDIRIGNLSLD